MGAIIVEEEAPALKSLNHRDSFILCLERKIYVWDGDSASPFVKNAANNKAEKMEAESNGELTVVREIDDAFWEALGGEGLGLPDGQQLSQDERSGYRQDGDHHPEGGP